MATQDGIDFDLVVLGTGTAGLVAATRVRKAGWQVAVVDHQPYGGTCVLRGCDPKKMLVGGASAWDHAHRMQGHGLAGRPGIDWPGLMRFKRTVTDGVPQRREQRFADAGIATLHGPCRFTGPDTVTVDGRVLRAKHFVIATGAEPATLGIPGEELLADHADFLALEKLPRRIVLVGGGYIAAEFSHIAARAGAEVTILQHGPRLLKNFDSDLVDWLMPRFHALGIAVHLGSDVQAVARQGQALRVTFARGSATQEVDADLVVHAAGRKPALRALDLDAAEVATEHGRLLLNEFLQSRSNPRVYAAGDAAQQGPPLTPVSSHDGRVVAANLLQGNHRRPDYRGVPSVAFTIPPIARVGLGQDEAGEQGLRFEVHCQQTGDWFTARQQAEQVYGHKVLVEKDSRRILGAHLVGPHAEEVINLFALAIRHGLTADDLQDTMFAYPSGASDIGSMV